MEERIRGERKDRQYEEEEEEEWGLQYLEGREPKRRMRRKRMRSAEPAKVDAEKALEEAAK